MTGPLVLEYLPGSYLIRGFPLFHYRFLSSFEDPRPSDRSPNDLHGWSRSQQAYLSNFLTELEENVVATLNR